MKLRKFWLETMKKKKDHEIFTGTGSKWWWDLHPWRNSELSGMYLWNLTWTMNLWPIWLWSWPGFQEKLGPSEVFYNFTHSVILQKVLSTVRHLHYFLVWLCNTLQNSEYRVMTKICQLLNWNCSSPAVAKIVSHCLTGDLPYRFQFSETAPSSHNCRIRPRPHTSKRTFEMSLPCWESHASGTIILPHLHWMNFPVTFIELYRRN